jgi:SOS response regulatory protein OraA/RecX
MAFSKPKLLDEAALKAYAQKLLAGRSLSTAELRERLRRRAQRSSDVGTVIDSLREYGAVDDRRFAEHFAAARKDSRGLGRQRAFSDLLKKRVSSKIAQSAVEQAYAGVDEQKLIEQYLARKYRTLDLRVHLREPKNLAAVYRRLRGAGFRSGPAISVLKRYAAAAEVLEGMEGPENES